MMISYSMGIVGASIAAVILISIFVFLWIKVGQNKIVRVLIASVGLISIIASFAMIMSVPRLYVVTAPNAYDHYLVYKPTTYTTAYNTTETIDHSYDEMMIINESDETVILEEVIYGFVMGADGNYYKIESETSKRIKATKATIHYFFDDEPPNEISVEDKSGEIRLWLRAYGKEDMIWEMMQEDAEEHERLHNPEDPTLKE